VREAPLRYVTANLQRTSDLIGDASLAGRGALGKRKQGGSAVIRHLVEHESTNFGLIDLVESIGSKALARRYDAQ
jgi:hypothetical protein